MATKILDNSSFSVLRVNPKLTTNIKLVVNESGKMFLDSFNANSELSNSKFKAFKIDPNSTYDKDIYRFYNNGLFPKEKAYEVLQESNDLEVLSNYGLQYEMFYSAGCETIDSEFYDEELGILAPLWLDDIIPDYFVIFRLDGPVTVNNVNAADENNNAANVTDPSKFIDNILSKSTIIKTFDLRSISDVGKYIRNYKNQVDFPDACLRVSLRKDENSTWNGISYKEGGFASKGDNIYEEFINRDSSIIEKEYFITKGFERNGIICANLINFQFLFTDNEVEDYKINRYFGLYVNEAEEGTFILNGKNFFIKADNHPSQLPKLRSSSDISIDKEYELEFTNEEGVILYIDETTIDTITGIPTPDVAKSLPSVFYLKDQNGIFHNIKTGSYWYENEIRLADTKIDIGDFTGFGPSVTDAHAELLEERGKAMAIFNINSNLPAVFSVSFYNDSTFLGMVAVDPSITIAGSNNNFYFCGSGTTKQIAKAMAAAIDTIPNDRRFFDATSQGNNVILVSRFYGDRFNKLNFRLNPLLIGSHFTHYPNIGNNLTYYFNGGSGDNSRRIKVKNEDANRFTSNRYIKTKTGFSEISIFLISSPFLSKI